MTAEALLAALALPAQTRVDQRIPKKLLQEHGAPTPADRRLLQSGIEEAQWAAVLKPVTVGTPPYSDTVREYLEIAVLSVRLHPNLTQSRATRLTKLVHRAIPYPVVLIATQGASAALSLARKRRSQSGAAEWVTEDVETTGALDACEQDSVVAPFLASLALAAQPTRDLLALYQGWMDTLTALSAARITGRYRVPGGSEDFAERRTTIDEHARLSREAEALRARAMREKQLARRVELNLNIRQLEARISALSASL